MTKFQATVLFQDTADSLLAKAGYPPGGVQFTNPLPVRFSMDPLSRLVGYADLERVGEGANQCFKAVVTLDVETSKMVAGSDCFAEMVAYSMSADERAAGQQGMRLKYFGLSAIRPVDPRETPLEPIVEEGFGPGEKVLILAPTGLTPEKLAEVREQFEKAISGPAPKPDDE